MKNAADNDDAIQPSSSTYHSERMGTWIGMALFLAFFILDWLSGWPI